MIAVALSEASFAALLKPIMDGGFVERDSEAIRLIPLLLIAAFVVRGIGSFADQYSIGWIGRKVVFDIREEMFNRIIRLPANFYDHSNSANLVSKLVYDVEQVTQAVTMAVRILIKDSLLVIALLFWLFFLHWQLTLVFLAVTPIAALIVRIASRRFRRTSEKIQTSIAMISHVSKEAFQGHRILKAFSGYRREEKAFEIANVENRRQTIKKTLIAAASVPLLVIFVGTNVALVIYLAMTGATGEFISAGTFASYLGAILMLMPPIRRLARVNEFIQTGVAAASSAFGILDRIPEDLEKGVAHQDILGSIEFRNVSFSYNADAPQTLKDLTFKVCPGQTIAFVGESGAGKSTIASILLGFYTDLEGKVLLDDIELQKYQLPLLRRNIGFVPQEAFLFDDTIIQNVCYGIEMNTDNFEAAIETTSVREFSEQLVQGLDTEIGERGTLLSGGQRQRIALARGLYRKTPILILDESTSALDSIAEKQILDRIQRDYPNKTLVMISHRLSTVINSDCIYVLQGGHIVEAGSHVELLSLNGYYKSLYQTQISEMPKIGDT